MLRACIRSSHHARSSSTDYLDTTRMDFPISARTLTTRYEASNKQSKHHQPSLAPRLLLRITGAVDFQSIGVEQGDDAAGIAERCRYRHPDREDIAGGNASRKWAVALLLVGDFPAGKVDRLGRRIEQDNRFHFRVATDGIHHGGDDAHGLVRLLRYI